MLYAQIQLRYIFTGHLRIILKYIFTGFIYHTANWTGKVLLLLENKGILWIFVFLLRYVFFRRDEGIGERTEKAKRAAKRASPTARDKVSLKAQAAAAETKPAEGFRRK